MCVQARKHGEGEGDRYATQVMSFQVKAPAGSDITWGASSAGPRNRGDTWVTSHDSVEKRREIFGAVVAEQKTDKSDYILLNMHPRSNTHTHHISVACVCVSVL